MIRHKMRCAPKSPVWGRRFRRPLVHFLKIYQPSPLSPSRASARVSALCRGYLLGRRIATGKVSLVTCPRCQQQIRREGLDHE